MNFCDNKNFGIVESIFLNNKYIGYGFFDSLKTKYGITPKDSTSIDSCKETVIIKLINEHLERKRMGIGLINSKDVLAFNYITKSVYKYPLKYFSYGYNEKYGFVDTTGSASGYNSNMLINKSISEIIEKNEMLLFWYSKLGKVIKIDEYIYSKFNLMNFISNEFYIFYNKNISNLHTYFIILFNNKKITSSGVSSHLNPKIALDNALYEAKLLEWQNYMNPKSPLNDIKVNEYIDIYDYVNHLKYSLNEVNNKEIKDSGNNIIISNEIKSLDIIILNGIFTKKSYTTVKCCSEYLMCCLPRKKYIKKKNNDSILKKLNNINNIPDCILL